MVPALEPSTFAQGSVQPGDLLASKYRVERVLGQGGMGVVVAARHEQLGFPVALKFMLPIALGDEGMKERFLREARAAGSLRSEHVARVTDFGTLETGAPYIVMEFLDGSDLGDALQRVGRFRVHEAAEYVLQACKAMEEAHALGIVHRDLKPQNLFLTHRPDGTPLVKVLDFGISKLTSVDGSLSVTSSQSMMGSPLYMAPEQIRSSKNVDSRADIYSLGVILYQLTTGVTPVQAETLGELFENIFTKSIVPLRERDPGIPAEFDALVMRCLAREPSARLGTVRELAAGLAQFVDPRRSTSVGSGGARPGCDAMERPGKLDDSRARCGRLRAVGEPRPEHQGLRGMGGGGRSADRRAGGHGRGTDADAVSGPRDSRRRARVPGERPLFSGSDGLRRTHQPGHARHRGGDVRCRSGCPRSPQLCSERGPAPCFGCHEGRGQHPEGGAAGAQAHARDATEAAPSELRPVQQPRLIMKRSLLLLSVLLSLSPLVAASARAQNAAEQAEARTLFDESVQLFQKGSYAEACAKLEASYHLFAGIGTRGKLAQCYEKVGRTASAWAMYQEVVALAGKAGDATREQVARERAAALLPTLSHLTVVLPASSDVPGLVVKRGKDEVERGVMGSTVPVDPGTVTFTISAPGHVTKTADVTVAPREQTTFTVPALDAAPPEAPPEVAAKSRSAAPPVEGGPPAATWQRPAGIAVAGVGVVAAAVGAVLALTAKSSYDGAFNSGDCTRPALMCSAAGQNQTDGARSQATTGGVLIGVGAVVAVGGGVLFFLGPHLGSPPASTGVRLLPALGPSTAGLTLTGGF